MELSRQSARLLLDLARSAIRNTLEPPDQPSPMPLLNGEPVLYRPAGCFVSLHELLTHRLRGCVGRIEAVDPLHVAVTRSARSVLQDPRFANERITIDDLPRLEIEISLLSPLRRTSDPDDFDLENEGIYLVVGEEAGCFLPQVARETGWTRQRLLDRLCVEKLGLPAEMWRCDAAQLFAFRTLLLGPEPFIETPGPPLAADLPDPLPPL